MSTAIEVAELGVSGRQVPDPTELEAVLSALASLTAADAQEGSPSRLPAWRFANRTWGRQAALLRTRPHRPGAF